MPSSTAPDAHPSVSYPATPRALMARLAMLMLARGMWIVTREPVRRLSTRAQAGLLSVVGLLLLGAPLGRALVVGIVVVIASFFGVNPRLLKLAAAALAGVALIAWALGISLR